ncbi:hypothetical protein JCM30760_26970 [Thiomicrorhabdus hydrogeniphila]
MRNLKMMDGVSLPEAGLNFIGLAYDPNWMPAFLVFEPNHKVFKTDEKGVGFILDVRGIISNMWFTGLLTCDPKEVVEKVLKVCSACYEDNKNRIDTLDDLEHYSIAIEVEHFRTTDNNNTEGKYIMYFPQYKPDITYDVGLFAF